MDFWRNDVCTGGVRKFRFWEMLSGEMRRRKENSDGVSYENSTTIFGKSGNLEFLIIRHCERSSRTKWLISATFNAGPWGPDSPIWAI